MYLPNLISKSAGTLANLETVAHLEAIHQQQRRRQRDIGLARDYYNGDQPTLLTDRQREFLHHRDRLKFCMNYCRLVIDAPAERLKVTGFEVSDQKVQSWLWKLWNAARLDGVSQAVHLAAVRDGEAYLLVDFDAAADRPRFTLNLADDGEGGITLVYDDNWQPLYAVKRWRVTTGVGAGGHRRMTVYFADRVEKYISTAAHPNWQPYRLEGEPFPIPWLDQAGQPLGIPVIPFRNRAHGTPIGMSEIQDVIPLQDALNKTLIDMIAVADTNAFPILVALGFEIPEEFRIAPGALIQVPPSMDGGSDFKMLQGANLTNFIDVLQHLVLEIARISSTPLSRFQVSGQVAAEGTLKQQEAGLIAKVESKQITFGNAWEDAMRLAIRLQNTFGAMKFEPDVQLSTLWSPAAPRSELEHLQALLLKAQLGVPVQTLLAEAGYVE